MPRRISAAYWRAVDRTSKHNCAGRQEICVGLVSTSDELPKCTHEIYVLKEWNAWPKGSIMPILPCHQAVAFGKYRVGETVGREGDREVRTQSTVLPLG